MKFSQIQQRVGNRFKQRIVPIVNGIYGAYSKLATVFGNPITISNASDKPLQGLRIFGKSTQNGTPTPDAPVEIVSVENPTVKVCGKNLIPSYTKTENIEGITVTPNENGSITLDGTATARSVVYFVRPNQTINISKGVYALSMGATLPIGVTCILEYYIDGVWQNVVGRIVENKSSATCTIDENMMVASYLEIKKDTTLDNLTIYPQLELSDAVTEYEKYIEPQSLTLSTPNDLLGIPVTSGGNYTDENGQQWICDEVDFERGVLIQRITRLELPVSNMNNSEEFPGWKNITLLPNKDYPNQNTLLGNITGVMCNGVYYRKIGINTMNGNAKVFIQNSELTQTEWMNNHPDLIFEILYVSSTPIETPLTADQIEAYKVLHTNEPNTTISNNQNAEMAVTYIMN